MDWSAVFKIIVDDIGVIPTILILGLGFVSWRLWQWGAANQSDRIDDQKEHTTQIIETVKTVDMAIRALEDRGRG